MAVDQNTELFTVGLAGMQSVGKTTFLNALLGYPLFPVCQTTGTSMPVSVVYGEKEEIYLGDRALLSDGLSPDIFGELLDYACLCVNRCVVTMENLEYFSDKTVAEGDVEAEDFRFRPHIRRHEAVLLLNLLVGYVGQNKAGARKSGAELMINGQRERLLSLLGIPAPERETSLSVCWNADFLKDGLKLVDLPGLDSIASVQGITAGRTHDEITLMAVGRCDLLLYMVTGEASGGSTGRLLGAFLRGERAGNEAERARRVLAVINRADRMKNPDATRQSVRRLLSEIWPVPVFCISASGGEYRFLQNKIPVTSTVVWKESRSGLPFSLIPKNMIANDGAPDRFGKVPQKEDIADAVGKLYEIYNRKYPFWNVRGEKGECTLEEFIVQHIPAYRKGCADREKARTGLNPFYGLTLLGWKLEEVWEDYREELNGLTETAKECLSGFSDRLMGDRYCTIRSLQSPPEYFDPEYSNYQQLNQIMYELSALPEKSGLSALEKRREEAFDAACGEGLRFLSKMARLASILGGRVCGRLSASGQRERSFDRKQLLSDIADAEQELNQGRKVRKLIRPQEQLTRIYLQWVQESLDHVFIKEPPPDCEEKAAEAVFPAIDRYKLENMAFDRQEAFGAAEKFISETLDGDLKFIQQLEKLCSAIEGQVTK